MALTKTTFLLALPTATAKIVYFVHNFNENTFRIESLKTVNISKFSIFPWGMYFCHKLIIIFKVSASITETIKILTNIPLSCLNMKKIH